MHYGFVIEIPSQRAMVKVKGEFYSKYISAEP